MAKTKTKSTSKKDILHGADGRIGPKRTKPQKSIEDLLTEATELLEQSQPELALPLAEEALQRLEQEKNEDDIDKLLQQAASGKPVLPSALTLQGEISLALGDAESAHTSFLRATKIDPDGALISAEPWLWLAQLCEEGGQKSIEYFIKATEVLRNEIEVLEDAEMGVVEDNQRILDEKKSKLANALCSMTEVYMTDLSWEDDAESWCEKLVTEAVAVCPERLSATILQTLANVRISQQRYDEARQSLKRSIELWKDIPAEVEDDARPDFAGRISLSRLLMEVEVEKEALTIIEGLVKEDDQSVEGWYLGGWCQVLMAQKSTGEAEGQKKLQEQSLQWLDTCLRLYRLQDYEDDRLKDHAVELRTELHKALGIEQDENDDDAWEDEDDDDDDDVDIGLNGNEADDDSDVEMT